MMCNVKVVADWDTNDIVKVRILHGFSIGQVGDRCISVTGVAPNVRLWCTHASGVR